MSAINPFLHFSNRHLSVSYSARIALLTTVFLAMGSCDSSKKKSDESLDSVLQLNPQTLVKLGSVDPRYQSYNVEMVEVVGGEFWKP